MLDIIKVEPSEKQASRKGLRDKSGRAKKDSQKLTICRKIPPFRQTAGGKLAMMLLKCAG